MSSEGAATSEVPQRRRLAIIGGGSSGLICLKYSLDLLADWEIVCFEKSGRNIGCWGNPYPGFVSTSTKYTTQFACFAEFDASVNSDGGSSRAEFFCGDEYGRYLERFVEEYSLDLNIVLHSQVESMQRVEDGEGWELSITYSQEGRAESTVEHFDCVILCTGLAAAPKQLACEIERLSIAELNSRDGLATVTNKCIVVIGGGESAVDYANRLAAGELNNRVFLSLQSGIRVSPRYHPIRGVPSDFLRNRLMLSIHEDLRNWIGQRFVELRIRYQQTFEWLFPKSTAKNDSATTSRDPGLQEVDERRKQWAYKLTKTAKDDLFNMFHNKSDDFLGAVADGRIKIVGPPVDNSFTNFREFDAEQFRDISPELIVPAVGYRARLNELSGGEVQLADFYLGCCHVRHPDLYLVGFARPIIGNIPTISEMQARYVCGLIAEEFPRPDNIDELHHIDRTLRRTRYKKLDTDAVYPVEMFPYCDQLARLMGIFPTAGSLGSLVSWCRMQLTPATTMHYLGLGRQVRDCTESARIYMPLTLVFFLLALKPISLMYSLCRRFRKRAAEE